MGGIGVDGSLELKKGEINIEAERQGNIYGNDIKVVRF